MVLDRLNIKSVKNVKNHLLFIVSQLRFSDFFWLFIWLGLIVVFIVVVFVPCLISSADLNEPIIDDIDSLLFFDDNFEEDIGLLEHFLLFVFGGDDKVLVLDDSQPFFSLHLIESFLQQIRRHGVLEKVQLSFGQVQGAVEFPFVKPFIVELVQLSNGHEKVADVQAQVLEFHGGSGVGEEVAD